MRLGHLVQYLAQCWPFDGRRQAVIAGYRVLGVEHKATLADIGLRNGLFAADDDADPHRALYQKGRRDAALEIYQLAKVDIAAVYALIETKPKKEIRT